MFRSYSFYVERDIANREWPWMAIWKEETPKKGFSFAGSHFPCWKFIWSEDFPFPFFHWSRITLFSSDLFLFTFSRPLIGNPSSSFVFIFFFEFYHPTFIISQILLIKLFYFAYFIIALVTKWHYFDFFNIFYDVSTMIKYVKNKKFKW